MTKEQIIQALRNDPLFGLRFALDNNFPAIKSKLAGLGFSVMDKAAAYDKIMALVQTRNVAAVNQVFNVPYMDEETNGTGGLRDFFVSNSPAPQTDSQPELRLGSVWSGVLSFVAGGLTGLNTQLNGTGSVNTTGPTPEQLAAQKAEEERQFWNRVWLGIGIFLFVVLLVILLVWLSKRGKKSAAS